MKDFEQPEKVFTELLIKQGSAELIDAWTNLKTEILKEYVDVQDVAFNLELEVDKFQKSSKEWCDKAMQVGNENARLRVILNKTDSEIEEMAEKEFPTTEGESINYLYERKGFIKGAKAIIEKTKMYEKRIS